MTIPRRLLSNQHMDFVRHQSWTDFGYKTGLALTRHAESAHEGKINQDCPACIEIQKKMAKENESVHEQAGEVPGVLQESIS